MPARRKKTTEPCAEHYPDGFPEGVDGVGCEHGSWTRDAAQESDSGDDSGQDTKD